MQFMIISRIKTFLNYQQVDYWDILFFTNMCYFFFIFFTIFARLSYFERRKKTMKFTGKMFLPTDKLYINIKTNKLTFLYGRYISS